MHFKIEEEKCSIRPIFGNEIGEIFRVLSEESKEPSKDDIIGRLKKVFADPISLAGSFYPSHLVPKKEPKDFIYDFDSRTYDFMNKLVVLVDSNFETS